MALFQLDDRVPQVHPEAYVAETAELIGSVAVEERASVWSNVVARGDNELITIGQGANVQEGTVLHTDMGYPLVIGAGATVGHQAMLHGCTVGEGALIGIQAVVLNGAKIGAGCLVGAGALVTEGKEFPPNMLILGSPAKAVREVKPEDRERIRLGAESYAARGAHYRTALKRLA